MSYQRKRVSDGSSIGAPGAVPSEIANWSAADLADISAASPGAAAALGLAGIGFVFVADPTPPPVIPQTVSAMQAQQALLNSGQLDAVNAAVAAGSREVQIYWAKTSEFHRNHPTLIAMTTALGMTSAQVDALFVAAAAIS
jgi:hypothetical protein